MIGQTPQLELLARALDAAALRHTAIAQNLANVNTPGYRRQEVAFEEDLARALDGQASPASAKPRLVESSTPSRREDGNNVDVETEMGELEKNTLFASAATQILALRLAELRSAISGR